LQCKIWNEPVEDRRAPVTAILRVEIENPPSMIQIVEFICAIGYAEYYLEPDARVTDAPFEEPDSIPMAKMMRVLRLASVSTKVTYPDCDYL
jgi:hypothetical protein